MILCSEELAADVNRSVFPGQQGGPLMHMIAAKAVALKIAQSEEFRERQRQTIANAQAFGEELIAGGVDVLTGGTDVHLVLVDLTTTGLFGKEAETAARGGRDHGQPQRDPVRRAPADEPSGLRIGTPALTTRGMVEDDMREIGEDRRRRARRRVRLREGRAARSAPAR